MFVAAGAKELLRERRRAEFHKQYIEPLVHEARVLDITTTELAQMIDQEDRK